MPFIKKKKDSVFRKIKKRLVKKIYRRKKSRLNKASAMTVKGLYVPDNTLLKTRFVSGVQIQNPVAGVTTNFVLARGNCVQYCVATGFGGLPYMPTAWDGYDASVPAQWSNFYNKAITYASAITCTVSNLMGKYLRCALVPVLDSDLATYINGSATQLDDFLFLQQQKYAKYWNIPPTGSGNNTYKLKHYMSTKKIMGVKNMESEDNIFQYDLLDAPAAYVPAAEGVNTPVRQFYWLLYFDSGLAATDVSYEVALDIVHFNKLKDRDYNQINPAVPQIGNSPE